MSAPGSRRKRAAAPPRQVLAHLAGRPWPGPGLPVRVRSPLLWVAPNRVHPRDAPPGSFVLRADRPLALPRLVVSQDGRQLHQERRPLLRGQPLRLSGGWTGRADPDGGPVLITV